MLPRNSFFGWKRTWKVDSKAIADGTHALTYLAPYVLRGAVANWRVTPCDAADSIEDARLSLQVKRSGTKKYRPVSLSVIEFIRRWLLHVLPAGLHRVRHYGFLHSSSRHSLAELKWLVAVAIMNLYYLTCSEELVMANSPKLRCPRCGGQMISLGFAPATLILAPVGREQLMSCLSARAPP